MSELFQTTVKLPNQNLLVSLCSNRDILELVLGVVLEW